MKTLNKWMLIFISLGILSIALLIANRCRTWETMSMELMATRLIFLGAAAVFLAAALVLHIVKKAMAEEQDKRS